MANTNVLFAGIGRMRDQLVLASVFDRITSQEKNEIETSFQNFLVDAVSRFSPGSREKRTYNGGFMYLIADRELCCLYGVAVRGKTYPERIAFSFLGEFVGIVAASEHGRSLNITDQQGLLTKHLRKPLKELMDKYDNPSNIDKVSEVQGKVDNVKGIMQDNINKVIATHANISELETKTDALNANAQDFNRSAGDLHRQMWWQKAKVTILLGLVCAAVLAYVIITIIKLAT